MENKDQTKTQNQDLINHSNNENLPGKINNNIESATKKLDKPDQDKDELLISLINQRLQEIKNPTKYEEEIKFKDLGKKYKSLSRLTLDNFNANTSINERLQKLYDATIQLIDYVSNIEEGVYLYNKQTNQAKLDKEISKIIFKAKSLVTQDAIKLSSYKSKLEKLCRDFQHNNNLLTDANKSFVEVETGKREELRQNFEGHLKDITEKLDEQSKGAQEQHQENEQLMTNLKEKIQQFESREKEVLDEIKRRDDENSNKTQEVLTKLKDIEKDAQEGYELRANLEQFEKNINDIKLKIILYSERFPEFEKTYHNTYEMQRKFKEEILKTASKLKTMHSQQAKLKQKNEKIDAATLEIITENTEIKKKIEESRINKEKVRNRCMQLQKELKEKDKELQELQKSLDH